MALPDVQLTAGQHKVMAPLIERLRLANVKLNQSQAEYAEALAAVEEYVAQAGEKLAIPIGDGGYIFDETTRVFKEKAAVIAAPVK